jgi:hypothetical protein
VGLIPELVEREMYDAKPVRIDDCISKNNSSCLRLDAEEPQIKGSMMSWAEDESVPRVVGTTCMFRAKVGGVEQPEDVQSAGDTPRSVALEHAKLEPLLSRSDRDLASPA